jgi:hypothetical protein
VKVVSVLQAVLEQLEELKDISASLEELKKDIRTSQEECRRELKINDVKAAQSRLKETVTHMLDRQLKGAVVVAKQQA